MAELLILKSFTGYPDGTDASERLFREGEVVTDLPTDFADLIIRKGHAMRGSDDQADPTAPVAEHEEAKE